MNMPISKKQFQDAMQAALGFAIKQTSHIEAGVYALRYPEFDYASLVPVDTSAHEWAKTVTYYSMDGGGQAEWINGNASDVPNVGMTIESHETAVHMAGIGYQYGYEEVNHAQMLGINLSGEKAALARRAYEEKMYNIAFYGDAAKGFEGLYDYTGVPTESTVADGTSSSALWADKTPDQILRDVNKILIGMNTATNHVEMANTLILPIERYQSLASLRLTDTAMTILDFLRQANVYTATTRQPLTIIGKRGLLTVGAGTSARMIAYRRSPEVLKMHLPMPHRFLPLQVDGLQFKVPGVFRVGGLDIRLPYAVRYGDGI